MARPGVTYNFEQHRRNEEGAALHAQHATKYTPMEDLYIYRSLVRRGGLGSDGQVNAAAWDDIATYMKDNKFVRSQPSYDPARYTANVIRYRILYLWRELEIELEEVQKVVESQDLPDDQDPDEDEDARMQILDNRSPFPLSELRKMSEQRPWPLFDTIISDAVPKLEFFIYILERRYKDSAFQFAEEEDRKLEAMVQAMPEIVTEDEHLAENTTKGEAPWAPGVVGMTAEEERHAEAKEQMLQQPVRETPVPLPPVPSSAAAPTPEARPHLKIPPTPAQPLQQASSAASPLSTLAHTSIAATSVSPNLPFATPAAVTASPLNTPTPTRASPPATQTPVPLPIQTPVPLPPNVPAVPIATLQSPTTIAVPPIAAPHTAPPTHPPTAKPATGPPGKGRGKGRDASQAHSQPLLRPPPRPQQTVPPGRPGIAPPPRQQQQQQQMPVPVSKPPQRKGARPVPNGTLRWEQSSESPAGRGQHMTATPQQSPPQSEGIRTSQQSHTAKYPTQQPGLRQPTANAPARHGPTAVLAAPSGQGPFNPVRSRPVQSAQTHNTPASHSTSKPQRAPAMPGLPPTGMFTTPGATRQQQLPAPFPAQPQFRPTQRLPHTPDVQRKQYSRPYAQPQRPRTEPRRPTATYREIPGQATPAHGGIPFIKRGVGTRWSSATTPSTPRPENTQPNEFPVLPVEPIDTAEQARPTAPKRPVSAQAPSTTAPLILARNSAAAIAAPEASAPETPTPKPFGRKGRPSIDAAPARVGRPRKTALKTTPAKLMPATRASAATGTGPPKARGIVSVELEYARQDGRGRQQGQQESGSPEDTQSEAHTEGRAEADAEDSEVVAETRDAAESERMIKSQPSSPSDTDVDTDDQRGPVIKQDVSTPIPTEDIAPSIDEAAALSPSALASAIRRPSHKRKRPPSDDGDDPNGPQTHVLWTRGFMKTCTPVLDQIASHREASMFARPVSERDAPGYKAIIIEPTDISTIRAAIKAGDRAARAAALALPEGDPGTPSVRLPISDELVPPKGIINSSQLKREIIHMFANAIMYNPDPLRGFGPAFSTRSRKRIERLVAPTNPDEAPKYQIDENGVVNSTRSMFAQVEKLMDSLRRFEVASGAALGEATLMHSPSVSAHVSRVGSASVGPAPLQQSASQHSFTPSRFQTPARGRSGTPQHIRNASRDLVDEDEDELASGMGDVDSAGAAPSSKRRRVSTRG